jgi:hypothetical protein
MKSSGGTPFRGGSAAGGARGSPDVFFEGQAGPYKLLVTIRPPQVVPGVAESRSAAWRPM